MLNHKLTFPSDFWTWLIMSWGGGGGGHCTGVELAHSVAYQRSFKWRLCINKGATAVLNGELEKDEIK